MGGLGGHMNHVYDNLNLSFGGLLDIFTQAAAGELTPTEKVDGQNLFFTYDLRDNQAKFARRADEAAGGGITEEVLNAEFVRKRDASNDPDGYQHVVDAFYFGMTAIEQALDAVPQEVLYTLFERLLFISADAYLSPLRLGKYLIFVLNIFATALIEYVFLLAIL